MSRSGTKSENFTGPLMRQMRTELGASRREFSALAGLSYETIKNYETGDEQVSDKSLSKIERACRILRKDSIFPFNVLDWTVTELDPGSAQEDAHALQRLCSTDDSLIPYEYLSLTSKSINPYLADFQTRDYQHLLESQRIRLPSIAKFIVENSSIPDFHIICLTCVHDWIDFDFIYEMGLHTGANIRASIVHPSYSLISHASECMRGRFENMPNVRVRFYIGSYEHMHLNLDAGSKKQRSIYCILGALNNHDEATRLLRHINYSCNVGDLLLIDTINKFDMDDSPKSAQKKDPRLNGQIPALWADLTNRKIEHVLREQLNRPADISISSNYAAKKRFPNALGSYAVEMVARIDDGVAPPWRVSGMRIYRQPTHEVCKKLEKLGWRLIAREDCGMELTPPYITSLLLFSR